MTDTCQLWPRSLAGKPFGLVPHYGKWTYYSLIRQYRARYTCQIPTMTLIIDDKKRAAWGESGFPSKFLAVQYLQDSQALCQDRS